MIRQIEEALEQAGARVRVVADADEGFKRAVLEGTADLVIAGWTAGFPDTHSIVHGLLHSREGFLGRICGFPEIDRLIEKAQTAVDPASRHSLYRQIEGIVARDALLVPLYHEQEYRFCRPEVEGLTLSYSSPFVSYENLQIRS